MAAHTILTRSAIAVFLLALAACGRAGAPEPPPASVSQGQQPGQAEPEVEDRPFILDRLLE